MRSPLRLLLLCATVAIPLFLSGGSRPHPPVASEAHAHAVLNAAVQVLGGVEHLSKLDRWFIEGKGRENLTGELQGLAPNAPTWRVHEERIAVSRATGSVAWERHSARNDLSWRWRRFIYKPDSFGVVDWTSGDSNVRPRTVPEAERQALMHRIPHLLVLDAATRAKGLRDLGVRKRNGISYDVVEAVMADDSHLTLWFTQEPVTLARVEYSVYIAGLGDAVVGWQWHGWKKDQALKLAPSGHAIDVNGTPFQQVAYTHYQTGTTESDRLLSIPADLGPESRTKQETPPSPAGPATGEVAPGVHIASIRGFQVMFVEFKDFVLLFDAPASAVGLESIPASDQDVTDLVSVDAAAVVARSCPTKPIRYVAISHHHSDHLGGVQILSKDGVTFFAAPSHVGAVRKALAAAHTLNAHHAGPSGSQARASVAGVLDRKTITDGRRTVEVINVGRNPHTDENLFLWMPQEKLLLQGDLFYYREGDRFPPPGRETMNRFFAKWLAARGMQPNAVYGVHGAGAASPEALARALRPIVSSMP